MFDVKQQLDNIFKVVWIANNILNQNKLQRAARVNLIHLGCIFLQESSGFLRFLFLWCFFHRNHDSCSAITFSEHHQETCLYGAYVGSYVGYQFVR
jgi:hypothetical protein